MELPSFPCIAVGLDELDHPNGVISTFLKERPSQRWVLIGFHAAQSMSQMWTAWVKTTRNELRESCVARSIDAEFMRYLAGTHHVSEAFERSGYQDGTLCAWIVHLPAAESSSNSLGHTHPMIPVEASLPVEYPSLLSAMKMNPIGAEMSYSIEGAKRLGIEFVDESQINIEEALIAHVLMADDQSASHR